MFNKQMKKVSKILVVALSFSLMTGNTLAYAQGQNNYQTCDTAEKIKQINEIAEKYPSLNISCDGLSNDEIQAIDLNDFDAKLKMLEEDSKQVTTVNSELNITEDDIKNLETSDSEVEISRAVTLPTGYLTSDTCSGYLNYPATINTFNMKFKYKLIKQLANTSKKHDSKTNPYVTKFSNVSSISHWKGGMAIGVSTSYQQTSQTIYYNSYKTHIAIDSELMVETTISGVSVNRYKFFSFHWYIPGKYIIAE